MQLQQKKFFSGKCKKANAGKSSERICFGFNKMCKWMKQEQKKSEFFIFSNAWDFHLPKTSIRNNLNRDTCLCRTINYCFNANFTNTLKTHNYLIYLLVFYVIHTYMSRHSTFKTLEILLMYAN